MERPMDQSLQVAKENLKEIRTVLEWSQKMGYDCPKYFSRKFRNYYGVRPKKKLIKIRMEEFFELIEKYPGISCYEVAYELGLRDEILLNKFIKRHSGKTPREWKNG